MATRSSSRARRIALAVGTAAAGCLGFVGSAEATLLVRADGNGLFVQDKNGLNDEIIFLGSPGTTYRIGNFNNFDIFRFDAQAGCTATFDRATCDVNTSKVRVELKAGNDRLSISRFTVSNSTETTVVASTGDDRVLGQDGVDGLNGGSGADRLEGLGGNDRVLGREGSDVLIGGTGVDEFEGDESNDAITSKEPDGTTSEADSVECGTGQDTVMADLRDVLSACESVDRSPVGETPHVRVRRGALAVNRAGVARVRLTCPRGTTIGCKGTLSLRLARRGARRPARTRYAIAAGRSRTVKASMTAAEARRLRGRPRGILTSLEKGRLGLKTTIRQPRLR